MSDRPIAEFTADQLKPRPFRTTGGGTEMDRAAYALSQIAETLARIDHRLADLVKSRS